MEQRCIDLLQDIFIWGLQTKNPKIREFFYQYYGAALYGIILKSIADEELAGRCLEWTFRKIYLDIDSYKVGEMRLFTWCTKITEAAIKDHLTSNIPFFRKIEIRSTNHGLTNKKMYSPGFFKGWSIFLKKFIDSVFKYFSHFKIKK